MTVAALTAGVLVATSTPALANCDDLLSPVNPGCILQNTQQKIVKGIIGMLVDATVWLAGAVGDSLAASGKPDLTEGWFTGPFEVMRNIGAMFALIALLCAVLSSVLQRDGRQLGRSVAQVLSAGLSTGLIGALVMMANALIDEWCDYIVGPGGWKAIVSGDGGLKTIAQSLSKMVNPINPNSQTAPVLLTAIICLLMIVAFVIIWIEMLVRRLAIDLCVLFWPLAVGGSVWPKAREWQSRLIDTLATVLLAKLFIVAILKLASSALKDSAQNPTASKLILCAALYFLAACAPFLVMKMVGFVGGAVQPGHTGEGLRAAAVGGAAGAITSLAGGASKLGSMMGGGSTPNPSAAGQAAAGQTATWTATAGHPVVAAAGALAGVGTKALTAGKSAMGRAAGELGSGGDGGGGGGAPELPRGKVIPGQLEPSSRPALPPASSGNGGGDGSPGSSAPSGSPPSGSPGSPGSPAASGPSSPPPQPPPPPPSPGAGQGGGSSGGPSSSGRMPGGRPPLTPPHAPPHKPPPQAATPTSAPPPAPRPPKEG